MLLVMMDIDGCTPSRHRTVTHVSKPQFQTKELGWIPTLGILWGHFKTLLKYFNLSIRCPYGYDLLQMVS